MHRIEKILDNQGKERSDGRYPLRKGCIGSIYYLTDGDVMVFEYSKDNQGNEKSGCLRTSMVKDINIFEKYLVVKTMNSIYYLEYLGE